MPECTQEIYRQFDTKFTYIYQEKRYFLANLSQQSIVGVSLFVLAMIMNFSCLVNISDDMDGNVKSSSDVNSRV